MVGFLDLRKLRERSLDFRSGVWEGILFIVFFFTLRLLWKSRYDNCFRKVGWVVIY